MFHKALDLWDERRARRSDGSKKPSLPIVDLQLAFPEAGPAADLEALAAHAVQAASDPSFFDLRPISEKDVRWSDGSISFPSSLDSDVAANDTVHASVERAEGAKHALVVFHHWNADERSKRLARFFVRQGITVAQMAMPYHMERKRPGAANVDDILSPNLGRTLRSMRQAVLDGRALVRILHDAGYERVSVLGMSLGSWVAGLVASHDRLVGCAGLFLSAGSLADMTWTGRATRHIRESLEGQVELDQLRRAWAPLDLERHAGKLARPDLALQFVLAKRDTVVRPELSEGLVSAIEKAGGEPHVLRLDCGHYSLSLPPFILWAGRSMASTLAGRP